MENVIDQKNILSAIADLSAGELEKLMSVLQVMLRFEKEKQAKVLPTEEIKELGEKWLQDLKSGESDKQINSIDKKPHSIILNTIINRCESKMKRHENAISEIMGKVSSRKNRIAVRETKINALRSRIEKCKQGISRINNENNFLRSLLGGKNDHSTHFIIYSNKKKLIKLEKRINQLQLRIAGHQTKISIQSSKISDLAKVIAGREIKINKQRQKIGKINDIIEKDMPHVALSYFLSERSGVDISELNKAIEKPKEFFSQDEVYSVPRIDVRHNEKENLISKLLDDVKSGEPEDYGYESGLKEIEKSLWGKSTIELQSDWKAVENQSSNDLIDIEYEWESMKFREHETIGDGSEVREQLELYAQFQGVMPSIGFDYTLENGVKNISQSVHMSGDSAKSEIAKLADKKEGVIYKEITSEQLERLDGQVFIFKRDDENPENFIIKFNEYDKEKIESAIKPPKIEKSLNI